MKNNCMTKITIEKIGKEITYKNITTTHEFLVNRKQVLVYCYDKQNIAESEYENDITIDEDCLEALTEEEQEIFEEELNDYLKLKVGKKLIVDSCKE